MERSGGHSERRRQILDAALRVFSERGFGAASIRAIADEAGLNSPPLVYWYFRSKRELFSEVLAHVSRRAPAFGFGDQVDREPEEVLPELARAELRAFGDPALVRLLRVAVAESAMNPGAAERFFGILRGEALSFLTRYLRSWGERRGTEGLRPEVEARVFFGSLFFYALNREVLPGFGPDLPAEDEYADVVVRQLLERLGPAGGGTDVATPGYALPPALARAGVTSRDASVGVEPARRDPGGVPGGVAETGLAGEAWGAPGDLVKDGTLEEVATASGAESADERQAAGSPPTVGGSGVRGDARSGDETSREVGGRARSGEPERSVGGEAPREPADRLSRLFEDLTRDTPKFVPLEGHTPDPSARPMILPFDPASPRASDTGRGTDEAPDERHSEGAGVSDERERTEAPAPGPGAEPVPAAHQPFPAEAPTEEPPLLEPDRDAPSGGRRRVTPKRAGGGVRKALFFVLPVWAHVQAALPVARELASRGEEVVFYATEEFEDLVRGAGVGFRALDPDFALPQELSEGYLAVRRAMWPTVVRSVTDSLRGTGRLAGWAREEGADYVVYDPLCPWGRPVSDALGLPTVGLYTTFVARENSPLARRLLPNLEGTPPPALVVQMVRLRWELREARSALGLPRLRAGDLLLRPGDLNVVTLPGRFQPPTGGALDDRFVFVGPSILQREERAYFSLKQIEAQPTVFFSLGPSYDEGLARLYGDCMEAFASSRWLVVMETGPGTDPALLGQAPPNVMAWPRVPRLEVLRRCDVFVTDGDVGATMEALWFGVPLVVVPRTPEQGVMAERIDELKTGLILDPRATDAAALREAVDAVGSDPSYHSGLADLWVAARHAGGHRLAADEIQAFVARVPARA